MATQRRVLLILGFAQNTEKYGYTEMSAYKGTRPSLTRVIILNRKIQIQI
jgi:hypothetical protein